MIPLPSLLGPAKVLSSAEGCRVPPLMSASTPTDSEPASNLSFIPTLAQLRDRGWMCHISRIDSWRRLGRNIGYLTSIDFPQSYTIATDGIHILLWARESQRWIEAHISNFDGPVSIHTLTDKPGSKADRSDSDAEFFLAQNGTRKRKEPSDKEVFAAVDDLAF